MATSSVASSVAGSSVVMTASAGLGASSGVSTATTGAVLFSIEVSGVIVSSMASAVTSVGLGGYTGGGFTFLGSAGSGAAPKGGVNVAVGAGAVASPPSVWAPPMAAVSAWPTAPSSRPAALDRQYQFSGGAFGMKLDNKPPVMHGSFDLYAVELETFLRRVNVWSGIEDPIGARSSTSDTQFAMMDNIARGAILHGVPTADAELIGHEMNAHEMWTRFGNMQTKREYASYIFARQQLYANKYTHERNMNDWLREM
ncbi:hypothetical protein F441_05158 [Phytophthora nicotianae CJ01A1]|uniref:Uncharacterized protein n=1 Tax=Phytophthora nicotianae CJ01A1 TaxID=1317063 RepID=W2XH20_PHYNI|nr:hypothetical protein F441_05158 [Phytophthora nicotianae CJ01A1]